MKSNIISLLLRARPKAERVHRQLAEIFHIERPAPALATVIPSEAYISETVRSIDKRSSLLGSSIDSPELMSETSTVTHKLPEQQHVARTAAFPIFCVR